MVKKKAVSKKFEIEFIYKTNITFKCPKRGIVTEEVSVKRYSAPVDSNQSSEEMEIINTLINEDDDESI